MKRARSLARTHTSRHQSLHGPDFINIYIHMCNYLIGLGHHLNTYMLIIFLSPKSPGDTTFTVKTFFLLVIQPRRCPLLSFSYLSHAASGISGSCDPDPGSEEGSQYRVDFKVSECFSSGRKRKLIVLAGSKSADCGRTTSCSLWGRCPELDFAAYTPLWGQVL